jgi:glycosyltransferase involved in cell wall biosynthesis
MKVLFVMENSVPIENAGCPIRNRYVMEHLKAQGFEIAGLTSPFMQVLPGQIIEGSEIIHGIRYYRSQYLNTVDGVSNLLLRWVKRYFMFKHYTRLLERICKEEKPDVIHAITSYLNGNAACKVGQKLGIPVVYEIRSIAGSTAAVVDRKSHESFKYQTVWKLDKKAMLTADRVAPLSNVLKNELIRRGIPSDKMDVVHNVVDTEMFVPQASSSEIVKKYNLQNKLVIGFIGSLRNIEGLEILVRAAPKITNKYPYVSFMIVGEGAELENLKVLARKEKVIEHFVFTGLVPHSQVVNYYSVIDIFALPRVNALVNNTVSPLKPLEIMAMGKVVVASDVGGLAEPIQEGKTGILFKAQDVSDLADKIIQLIGDEGKRDEIGKEARNWVIQNRNVDMLTEQYIPIYEKLLQKKLLK